MANYIDGFVFPIARDNLVAYQSLAIKVAEIWKEHGALEYCEYVGDDMKLDGTRMFPGVVNASDEEDIVFGWVVFESRLARDQVNKLVAEDPRIVELIAKSKVDFNAKRMAYGGFKPLVHISS